MHIVQLPPSELLRLQDLIEICRPGDEVAPGGRGQLGTPLDVLIALQRLSSVICTTTKLEQMVQTLTEIASDFFPVLEADYLVFEGGTKTLRSLSPDPSARLRSLVDEQLTSGVLSRQSPENSIIVLGENGQWVGVDAGSSVAIIPLILRNERLGVYAICIEKCRAAFSPADALLLSLLANQTAIGIEQLRVHQDLLVAREQVKDSDAKMVQAAKLAAIGELAAGIAHEIKNPLQVLMLHLEMVKAGNPLPNWMDMFSKQVQRLSDIAIRLMKFARDTSDEVVMEPVNVGKALEEIVAMVHHEFSGNGIEFKLSVSSDLPPVSGNANYLQQVFLNLLINARDAMPEGGTIAIGAAHTGFHVSIQVSDTGLGMKKEVLEKIFMPFFTTKGERGTGLGLAICRKIVAQHKGELRVESEEGKGTTFTIYLPVWREPSRTEPRLW